MRAGILVLACTVAILTIPGCGTPSVPGNSAKSGTSGNSVAGNKAATPPTNSEIANVSLETIGLTKDGWYQSWDQAIAKSKETGRPILADFTGSDWCSWCIKLDEEVFSKDGFKKWADEKVILLKLDLLQQTPQAPNLREQTERLAQKFSIRGFPTVLFLDSGEKVLGQHGYEEGGPEAWTKKADEMLKPTGS